jgi:hypothetical protein
MIDPRYAAIIEEWADELAGKLGRPASDIRAEGLSPRDFSNQQVEIEFEDSSYALFHWAFYIESTAKRAIAVFTEHCGYYVIPIAGASITIIPEDVDDRNRVP